MEYDATQCTMENICRFIDETLEKNRSKEERTPWRPLLPDMINALANLMSARAELIKAEFDINSYQESKFRYKEI